MYLFIYPISLSLSLSLLITYLSINLPIIGEGLVASAEKIEK